MQTNAQLLYMLGNLDDEKQNSASNEANTGSAIEWAQECFEGIFYFTK